MSTSETTPATKEIIYNNWFNQELSDILVFPSNVQYTEHIVNNTVRFERAVFRKPNCSCTYTPDTTGVKQDKSKNYSKIIETLTEKLKASVSEADIKKYTMLIKASTTKMNNQKINANKNTKTHTTGVMFTLEQSKILTNWFYECIRFYNACVDEYDKEYAKENRDLTMFTNEDKLKTYMFHKIYPNNQKPASHGMLAGEIESFCGNLKSCISNLKAGNIKHFKIERKEIKRIQSVRIPLNCIGQKGLFVTELGPIVNWKNKVKQIENTTGTISRDSRLVYDRFRKTYVLKIPYYAELAAQGNKKDIVALDPGEKVFQSYYALEECGKIGNDIRIKLLKYETAIRRYQRIANKKGQKNRIKNKGKRKSDMKSLLEERFKDPKKNKLRNRKAIRNKIKRKFDKLKNIVKEVHNQAAKYLTDNFKTILIPKFETQKMLCSKEDVVKKRRETIASCESLDEVKKYKRKSRLNKRVKFLMNQLSHYRFRQHLETKCLEKGCHMIVVDESYTSQVCGVCGTLSKNYDGRVKACPKCKTRIDRDINGSRNILMKNWGIIKGLSAEVPAQP